MNYDRIFIHSEDLTEDQNKIINTSLLITTTEYVIQNMLAGFKEASLDDPNIMTSVAAQLQFIRISACNDWYDNVFKKQCTDIINGIANKYGNDEKYIEELNNILLSKTETLVSDTNTFIDILNELSVEIVDELNTHELVVKLNEMMPTDKIFKPVSFERK